LQFIPNTDLIIDDYVIEYFHQINNKLFALNQNIDTINNLLPRVEEIEELTAKELERRKFKESILEKPIPKDIQKSKKIIMVGGIANSPKLNISNSKMNEIMRTITPQQTQPQYPEIAFLHMIKYSMHIIESMYLSLTVYKSLKLHKQLNFNQTFTIKNLLLEISNFLYPLTRLKNIKFDIEYNNDLVLTPIVSCLEYYKIIFFNLLFFIINNTSNTDKKSKSQIKLSIDAESINDIITYKILIHKITNNNIINYRDLNDLLNKNTGINFDSEEMNRLKIVDLGVFTAVYTIKYVFNEEFLIKSDDISNHEIIFNLKAQKSITNLKSSRNKYQFDEIFYNRFLEKFYKIEPPIEKNKIQTIHNLKTFIRDINKNKRSIENITFTSTEEVDNNENIYNEITSLKKDYSFAQKFNISYLKSYSDFDSNNSIKQNNIENYLKTLRNKSHNTKFISSSTANITFYNEESKKQDFKLCWENNLTKEVIKHFEVPIFLIVEVNN